MNISRALYTILSTSAPITSLVGTRIYPVQAPQQATFPYIVFVVPQNLPINRQNAAANADYIYPEIITVTKTVDENESIATAIRSTIDRMATTTVSGISFGVSMFESYVGPQWDDEDDTFISNMTFRILIHR